MPRGTHYLVGESPTKGGVNECFSFSEIAGMLGVSKGSVEVYVMRAQKKYQRTCRTAFFLYDRFLISLVYECTLYATIMNIR